jgi:hypothetical protein
MGSFTGAVPCQRVTQGYKGRLSTDGHRAVSTKAKAGLTASVTARAGTKVGLSDPPMDYGCPRSLTDKSYPGDNRVVAPESSYRRRGSLPRCRLTASWGCRRSQGLVCSPIKAVRELGSERRETVRTLSGGSVES